MFFLKMQCWVIFSLNSPIDRKSNLEILAVYFHNVFPPQNKQPIIRNRIEENSPFLVLNTIYHIISLVFYRMLMYILNCLLK